MSSQEQIGNVADSKVKTQAEVCQTEQNIKPEGGRKSASSKQQAYFASGESSCAYYAQKTTQGKNTAKLKKKNELTMPRDLLFHGMAQQHSGYGLVSNMLNIFVAHTAVTAVR